MKTKTLKKNKVNIVTLGCSKNVVDSEVIYTQLNRDITKSAIKEAHFIPSGEQYQIQVADLVDKMQRGQLNKAVLARILELELTDEIDVSQLFYHL